MMQRMRKDFVLEASAEAYAALDRKLFWGDDA